MTTVILSLFSLIIFSVLSVIYVYKYRGQERYKNFVEYFRKGWPIFAPLNCFLYIFTQKRASKAVMNMADFPELKLIQDNWQTIAEEAQGLYQSQAFDSIKDKDSASYYDVGFRTFYKYGWSKYYLSWYGGYEHASAKRTCPKTQEILKQCPSVNGAMFSLLPPGSELTRHLDPCAASMRYHLGLSTPNQDNAFINVDGQNLSWRDGEAFMFDETYLHYAQNNTDDYRLILMCDVNRPTSLIGSIFNNIVYKPFLKATIVPNTDEDERGFANKAFASLTPILDKGKALKKTNKPLYKVVKWTINSLLLIILLSIITAIFYIPYAALNILSGA